LTEPIWRAISKTRRVVRAPRKAKIMNWETPSFEEIDMSAEIGSYQGEDDNGL
jgi:coenzyme PQQ precursor peptide PqqA